LSAEVSLKRSGYGRSTVRIHDLSPHGCKVDFIDRPRLDEKVSVKIKGLEVLSAMVCWVELSTVGLEFDKPIHPAVFDMLVKRLSA
jgi:hypothetical protein